MCGGRVVRVLGDGVEGGAERDGPGCGGRAVIADIEEHWADADPAASGCPCGGGEFEGAVAFAAVRVGADRGIDHSAADHLLSRGLASDREGQPRGWWSMVPRGQCADSQVVTASCTGASSSALSARTQERTSVSWSSLREG